jgi:hypothetical protein
VSGTLLLPLLLLLPTISHSLQDFAAAAAAACSLLLLLLLLLLLHLHISAATTSAALHHSAGL